MSDQETKLSPDHRRAMGRKALEYQDAVMNGDPATHCDDSTGSARSTTFGVNGFGGEVSKHKPPKEIWNPFTDEWEIVS